MKSYNKRWIINLILLVMGMIYLTFETTFFKILGAILLAFILAYDAGKWKEVKATKSREKYNINLDKPCAIIIMVSLFYLWFRSYQQKNLFDFILFSTFLILFQLVLFKNINKMKPFIEKVKSK